MYYCLQQVNNLCHLLHTTEIVLPTYWVLIRPPETSKPAVQVSQTYLIHYGVPTQKYSLKMSGPKNPEMRPITSSRRIHKSNGMWQVQSESVTRVRQVFRKINQVWTHIRIQHSSNPTVWSALSIFGNATTRNSFRFHLAISWRSRRMSGRKARVLDSFQPHDYVRTKRSVNTEIREDVNFFLALKVYLGIIIVPYHPCMWSAVPSMSVYLLIYFIYQLSKE